MLERYARPVVETGRQQGQQLQWRVPSVQQVRLRLRLGLMISGVQKGLRSPSGKILLLLSLYRWRGWRQQARAY